MNHYLNRVLILTYVVALSACVATTQNKPDSKETDSAPKLRRPEVRKVWVPDQIIGDEYIQGHFKFLIERPAVWTKEGE